VFVSMLLCCVFLLSLHYCKSVFLYAILFTLLYSYDFLMVRLLH
jgi:hypothetical protein